jgi:hypothetical protein
MKRTRLLRDQSLPRSQKPSLIRHHYRRAQRHPHPADPAPVTLSVTRPSIEPPNKKNGGHPEKNPQPQACAYPKGVPHFLYHGHPFTLTFTAASTPASTRTLVAKETIDAGRSFAGNALPN